MPKGEQGPKKKPSSKTPDTKRELSDDDLAAVSGGREAAEKKVQVSQAAEQQAKQRK